MPRPVAGTWSDDTVRCPLTIQKPSQPPPSVLMLGLMMRRLLFYELDVYELIESHVHQARLRRLVLKTWAPRDRRMLNASTGVARLFWEWTLAMDMWQCRGYGPNVVIEIHEARMAATKAWMATQRSPQRANALNAIVASAATTLAAPTNLYVPPRYVLDMVLCLLDSRFAPDPLTLEDYYDYDY